MNIAQTPFDHKSENLLGMAQQLQHFVRQAAQLGSSLYETEKCILATVLKMGHLATDTFLQLQGDGDLGQPLVTEEGQTLVRSQQPRARPLRTVFGEHTFTAYVYGLGPKKQIALRPIDARLNLSEGKGSYLWEEFSQYFCIEQAFGQSAAALETVLGQKVSVDTFERTNRRLGEQAEQFLDTLPAPPPDEEGELLVATADGKGVPLIREQVDTSPVHGPRPSRPNNRRMATLACVYSVDPYVRTAEDIVAALFRDQRTEETSQAAAPRPRPCHKRMTACFSELADAGTENELRMRGDIRAWTWAAEQIRTRRRDGQVLIRLCDGQPSLWSTSDICLGLDLVREENSPDDREVVDILDILHVSGYVWLAARALYGKDEAAVERFARARLLRILQGQAAGVISGMRRMASQRNLRGPKLQAATKACDYLAKNVARMRYDEYLSQGYPIASGVIEGACRHLVKDRMERTGMRWRESHAGRMLYLRAVFVTDLWEPFQTHRQAAEQARVHPHRSLLSDYTPAISLTL
jgi:hypothetical protein